jgi:hypothetical protein
MTTVAQELLSLGSSRFAATRIWSRGRSPRRNSNKSQAIALLAGAVVPHNRRDMYSELAELARFGNRTRLLKGDRVQNFGSRQNQVCQRLS